MGSSTSKAVQNTTRKFPTRPGGTAVSQASHQPGRSSPAATRQKKNPAPTARSPSIKDDAIRRDAMDPSPPAEAAFADRLRQMGVVRPNPTLSHSSTAGTSAQNTTLSVLEARRRIQAEAEREFADMGRASFPGRQFLDAATIREVLVLRARGIPADDIERRLRLRPGVVDRLGPPGMVAALGGAAS